MDVNDNNYNDITSDNDNNDIPMIMITMIITIISKSKDIYILVEAVYVTLNRH